MKTFKATKYSEEEIELTSTEHLEELYKVIESDENFILKWQEGDVWQSEVMIGNNLSAKVKNGDIKLSSKEGGKK